MGYRDSTVHSLITLLRDNRDTDFTIRHLTVLVLMSLQTPDEERLEAAYQRGFDAGYEARVVHEQPPATPTPETTT